MLLNGYKLVYLPSHPRAYQNGCVYEHILKAEEKLGRFLLPEEVVHHIDHNKLNNSLDNLLVFATGRDHAYFHTTDESMDELVLQENGSYICPNKRPNRMNVCGCCGKEIKPPSKYCINCVRTKHLYTTFTIDRDEFKHMIRTIPFTTLGKMYNVSDKAVSKWCKKYDLPTTKKEIKSYSDEEWALL